MRHLILAALVVLAATPSHAQLRAQGRIVDPSGSPVSGSVYPYRVTEGYAWRSVVPPDAPPEAPPSYGAPLVWSPEVSAGAVGPGHPKGVGYFDFPGGLPDGEYWLDVHPGGWAGPYQPGSPDVVPVYIGGPPPPLPDLRDAPPITPIARQFTAGTWTNSVSYYGCFGAPLDRIQRDLTRFRAKGFGNARCWVTWSGRWAPPDATLFRRDGSMIPERAALGDAILDFAASIGVSLDFTFSGEMLDGMSAHKAAVRAVLTRWGNHPALRLVDVENEAEDCSDGCIDAVQFADLMSVARSVPHSALVSASVSGSTVPDSYRALFARTRGDLLLPHFQRDKGWGAKEGDRARELARAVPGLAIYHQEPARRGQQLSYDKGDWTVADFEAGFKTAKAAGSVGECFHTQAGFDVRTRDAWDQLDSVERQVVESVDGWTR